MNRTTTIWTCDRCGATEEYDEAHWQPQSWIQLIAVKPPRASLETTNLDRLAELCLSCRQELRHWLEAVDQ